MRRTRPWRAALEQASHAFFVDRLVLLGTIAAATLFCWSVRGW
jgi:hypothetical protein